MSRPVVISLALLVSSAPVFAAPDATKPNADQLAFFEKKIRPVLADKCYKCHSEKSDKIKGGLVLDTREGIRRGGDSGPAVVPGKLDDSLLIEAIRYQNKDFAMPPEKSGGKLAEAVIKDFEAWVQMGAPDPRDGGASIVKKPDARNAADWWAFKAPVRPAISKVNNVSWPHSDIDRFVLAGLEAKGLKPVEDASKAVLVRRVYFDLVGLPPTLKETDDFMKDTSPDALAKVVDRLLSSPQFGERWGRHWLDVARYAESSGKDVNITYPHAWRYRDYVIKSFNDGKPFDQFLREQLAGDLLPSSSDSQRAEQLIATGFLAIGAKSHNEQNPRQFYLDLADEQVDAVSQSILGLTVACARCHDHKFDPIPQRDYYGLAGIFLSTDTKFGTASGVQNRRSTDLIELPPGAHAPVVGRDITPAERTQKAQELADLQNDLADGIRQRFGQRQNDNKQGTAPITENEQRRRLRATTESGRLEAELKSYDEDGKLKAMAMAVQDLPSSSANSYFSKRARRASGGDFAGAFRARQRARPPEFSIVSDAHLYARGEADRPGEFVPRAFPTVLTPAPQKPIPNGTSGRRELANWLTSTDNPLTARVFVNRTWHWLFGRGIVESCDNFGTMGKLPSNQALLDYLALRFEASGWNVKALIRDIVLSRTYALSSNYDEHNFQADPENALTWRANKRRLDAECLRDAMLAVSGALDKAPPVGSVIAGQGDGIIGGPRNRGTSEEAILNAGDRTGVRSVYLPNPREISPDVLAVFDFVDSTLVTGTRETTNVPSQALYLLNDTFVGQQAQKMADRVLQAYPGGPNAGTAAHLEERVLYAYWIVFNRPPDAVEEQASVNFFTKFPSNWAKGDKSTPGLKDTADNKAAWTSFCRALFASAEFRYVN